MLFYSVSLASYELSRLCVRCHKGKWVCHNLQGGTDSREDKTFDNAGERKKSGVTWHESLCDNYNLCNLINLIITNL